MNVKQNTKSISRTLTHYERTDIIVIGASMGGFRALQDIISDFPDDLSAAVFVVLHIQPERKSMLAELLGRNAKVSVIPAKDGDSIELGTVYIAVPDFHMRLEHNKVCLDHGPRHNFSRPAIDPLFTSAAEAFGPRVVGVILSGALDDGSSGLMEVKRRGGIAIVQDPADAVNPSMPASALDCVPVDYCVPISEMGKLLSELAGKPVTASAIEKGENMPEACEAELSTHICPECNGPMWFVEDGKLITFHCRIGHYFSGQSLLVEKTMALESALWSAVNALKDKADISERLAKRISKKSVSGQSKEYYLKQAATSTSYANVISELLLIEQSPTELASKKTRKKSKSKKDMRV